MDTRLLACPYVPLSLSCLFFLLGTLYIEYLYLSSFPSLDNTLKTQLSNLLISKRMIAKMAIKLNLSLVFLLLFSLLLLVSGTLALGTEYPEPTKKQWQHGRNPYVFEDQHYTTGFQSEHGRIRVLQKFTERSKDLLLAVENYRLVILEAEPETFTVPHHYDAEVVAFVVSGRGATSLVRENRRESFNIRRGHIIRIRSGTTTYWVNTEKNEKLVVVKLLQPVSIPGRFVSFYGARGQNPESFYRAFSTEILEAALNTSADRLQRLFEQQRQGLIIKASEEQIRELGQHEEGGIWPFSESKGAYDIFDKDPSQSNDYGQLREVGPSDSKKLRELDVAISLANITQGSMIGPYYNSRSTKISVVLEGEGRFQMACPHLSSSESNHDGPSYQRVSADLRPGVAFVVPAGHPVVNVASSNRNLLILCFEINARHNRKYPLAGRRNVIDQLERAAKELAFNIPAEQVDEVFESQDEEFFFRGPRQQEEGRADA